MTKEVLTRQQRDYIILPVPEEAIKRVNRMGRKNWDGIQFCDHNNEPDESNDEDNEDYIPEEDEDFVPSDDAPFCLCIRPLVPSQTLFMY